MASFIPSYIQKRLLRYALARLELLDSDALDLENLDIALGKRSTIELRDVGLRLPKLTSLLHLPERLRLAKARILRLRVTVPADIYNSGIIIEVDGVIAQIEVLEPHSESRPRDSRPQKDDGRNHEPKQPGKRLRSPPLRENNRRRALQFSDSDDDEEDGYLPTTQDLAKSFLDVEPQEEKEELEAAINTQSQRLSDSSLSTSESTADHEVGTGTEITLPAFLAGFLKGIRDRLEVKIRNVEFRLNLQLSGQAKPEDSPVGSTPASISLRIKQLSIEGITVDGATQTHEADHPDSIRLRSVPHPHVGKRRIQLDEISAYLIMKEPLFEMASKNSRSPSVASHPSKKNTSRSDDDATTGGLSMRFSPASSAKPKHYGSESPVSERVLGPEGAEEGLGASITTADSDRFADPFDDDEPRTPVISSPSTSNIPFTQASSDGTSESIISGPHQEELRGNDMWNSHVNEDISSHQYSPGATRVVESDIYARGEPLYQSSLPGMPGSLNTSDLISFEEGSDTASYEQDDIQDSFRSVARSRSPFGIGHPDRRPSKASTHSSMICPAPSNADFDDGGSGHATPVGEGMSESKIYSHEEAESMYMSAMTAASAQSAGKFHLPGAWDSQSESEDEQNSHAVSTTQEAIALPTPISPDPLEDERCETPKPKETSVEYQAQEDSLSKKLSDVAHEYVHEAHDPSDPSADGTVPPSTIVETDDAMAKQFLAVDEILLWIPERHDQAPADDGAHYTEQSNYHELSGTFSEYAENGASRRRRSSVVHRSPQAPPVNIAGHQARKDEFKLSVGDIELNGDVRTIQLLSEIVQLLLITMRSESPPVEVKKDETTLQSPSTVQTKFSIQNFSIFLVEHLQAVGKSIHSQDDARFKLNPKPDSSDVLFKCCLGQIQSFVEVSPRSTTFELGVSHFSLGYHDEDILSFDDSARLRTSVRDLKEPQVDAISVAFSNADGATRINVGALPVNLNFDLQKLDDTLISFGGVSGVLELSSSIMSNSTILADCPSPKRARGVHFESPPPKPELESTRTTKVNVRFGGSLIVVRGKSSSVTFQSSAIKVLFRPKQGLVGLSVDEIRLAGPHLLDVDKDPPALVHLAKTRIEFLFTPKDDDLERLLSLLTPSRDKYENDDDILIDTLLRQRRKGSVIRVSVGKAGVEIDSLDSLQTLTKLGDDMSKLSTVAKYLPGDDRPGILMLCTMEELDVTVSVNDLIGTLKANARGFQIAYVGLPSLFAMEIGTIQAQRNDGEQLVHSVLDLPSPEQLPMIMARFLGGEIEPTVKVKFFNLCVEYRVPTMMAILGLKEGATAEDMVVDLTASVATITEAGPKNLSPQSTKSSGHLGQSPKFLKLEVLLRDCALGLNPRNMTSKILVVLTDTKMLSNLPGKENLNSTIDFRKASILMIDQEDNKIFSNEHVSKRPGSAGLGSRQVTELCKRGYVSVSYISAARADLRVLDNADGSKTADVELRDDLFVLETCADSTQTLFATLSALKPPTPPSRDIKYRTEVMPVEEMMASFTGDAFTPSRDQSEDLEASLELEEGDLLDDEELPANDEFVRSFYNPDPQSSDEEFGDNMLNEHIEQIASPRPVREIGGQPLLESFQEQYEVGSDNGPLNFEEDYFGTGSEVKGHARKWNSVKNQLGAANEFKVKGSPLKVRARDVHIIWNLFDGYDWQSTRDVITKTVKDVEHRAEERRSRRRRSANMEDEDEESVIGDFLFNSIYIGIPANRDPKELTRQINRNVDDLVTETESLATGTTTTVTAMSRSPSRGQSTYSRGKRLKVHRSKQHKITFELKSVSMDMIVFPPGSGETQSSIDIKIKEFEIFDHVPTSTWKKFATYLHDAGEPEMGKPMIRLEILTVKPVAELAASELVLKVHVLPLRLHVDQDALDFITRFFEFKPPSENKIATAREDEIFLQRVEVNTVRVRLDYKPKKVDYAGLRSGHTGEFMNFFILDGADFYLRHVIVYGVLGFDKLHNTLNDIWMPDVRKNQLPGVLAGLAPVRGLVNVGSGVRNLVVVPMREYRKDGRVVRSIQKGAVAFAKTTTSELARLGAKLAIGTHTALQGAETMLSPAQASHADSWEDAHLSSDDEDAPKGKKNISAYADPPINISSGLRSAAQSLERDLLTARDAIIAIPGEVADAEGLAGGARAVVRRAPTVLLRPAMGVAGAVGKVGLGFGNWVDPEGRRREEREGKWKRH